MKKKLLLIVLFLSYQVTNACTIIIGHKNGRVLVGNNEDWYKSDSKYWFENTKSKGQSIKTCFFGFDGNGRFPQGGINSFGLFFDGTFASKISVDKNLVESKDLSKPSIMIFRNVLKKCKNIEEATVMLKGLYFPFIQTAQVIMTDKDGNYLIIKANGIVEEGIVGEGEYKIITNFHLEELDSDTYVCYRYDLANDFFSNEFSNTVDEFENVLSLTHQEYPASTVYSNIFDLSNSRVNVYYNNYFDNAFKIDLNKDFKKGDFSFEEDVFKKRMIDHLIKNYKKGGLEKALTFYEREKLSETTTYIIDDEQLVDFAEYLSLNGESKESKNILMKNIDLFPNSDKNFEALGRVYLRKGEIDMALKNYHLALEKNRNNWWANDMVKQYENNPCDNQIMLKGYENAKSVKIEGDFNEWIPIRNVCTLTDGVWTSCIRTKSGTYKYRFIVDGKEVIDPNNISKSNSKFSEIQF